MSSTDRENKYLRRKGNPYTDPHPELIASNSKELLHCTGYLHGTHLYSEPQAWICCTSNHCVSGERTPNNLEGGWCPHCLHQSVLPDRPCPNCMDVLVVGTGAVPDASLTVYVCAKEVRLSHCVSAITKTISLMKLSKHAGALRSLSSSYCKFKLRVSSSKCMSGQCLADQDVSFHRDYCS
jgi:hypothetical protein